jgi:hypothetical protein
MGLVIGHQLNGEKIMINGDNDRLKYINYRLNRILYG